MKVLKGIIETKIGILVFNLAEKCLVLFKKEKVCEEMQCFVLKELQKMICLVKIEHFC